MGAAFVIIAELLVFLACGIVLGLCRVSTKVISVAVPVIFIKGIIWDAHFLGGVHTVSLVVTSLSVVYFVSGWALYCKRGKGEKNMSCVQNPRELAAEKTEAR